MTASFGLNILYVEQWTRNEKLSIIALLLPHICITQRSSQDTTTQEYEVLNHALFIK